MGHNNHSFCLHHYFLSPFLSRSRSIFLSLVLSLSLLYFVIMCTYFRCSDDIILLRCFFLYVCTSFTIYTNSICIEGCFSATHQVYFSAIITQIVYKKNNNNKKLLHKQTKYSKLRRLLFIWWLDHLIDRNKVIVFVEVYSIEIYRTHSIWSLHRLSFFGVCWLLMNERQMRLPTQLFTGAERHPKWAKANHFDFVAKTRYYQSQFSQQNVIIKWQWLAFAFNYNAMQCIEQSSCALRCCRTPPFAIATFSKKNQCNTI